MSGSTARPLECRPFPVIIRTDFIPDLQEVITNDSTRICEHTLSYTARRTWKVVPIMTHAELVIENRAGQKIAHAKYHRTSSGFDINPAKYSGTKAKMDPIIDELLKYN